MSDNRRVHRTIRMALEQLVPTEPKGNPGRMLTTLAALVSGMVLGNSSSCRPLLAKRRPCQNGLPYLSR